MNVTVPKGVATNVYAFPYNSTAISVTWVKAPADKDHTGGRLQGYLVTPFISSSTDKQAHIRPSFEKCLHILISDGGNNLFVFTQMFGRKFGHCILNNHNEN